MNKKRAIVYGLVLAVLAALVYLQFRQWRNFDWGRFLEHSRDITWRHVIHGIVLTYVAYLLRAIRWKIFLRPVRKDASTLALLPATIVGFTGLALLGRPGELMRPYLIARRMDLSVSSQFAVWVVERVFDLGAFTTLMVSAIFLPTKLRAFAEANPQPVDFHLLRLHLVLPLLTAIGYGLAIVLFCFLSATILVNYKGLAIAQWVEGRFSHLGKNLGHRIAQRIREFADGLNTIHGPGSFLQLAAVSLLMWWLIALSYKEVTHAYGAPMQHMDVTKVLLLMGASMVGSMVQLPVVGGGTQLATSDMLAGVFSIPPELALSCGILLWLVSFMAIVPVGLLLAHRERLSLRKVAEESEKAEAEENST